jgi:hypothetical protein
VTGIALATVTVYSQGTVNSLRKQPHQLRGGRREAFTPTPINWSTDPVLKRFVFRGIGQPVWVAVSTTSLRLKLIPTSSISASRLVGLEIDK